MKITFYLLEYLTALMALNQAHDSFNSFKQNVVEDKLVDNAYPHTG